MQGKPIQSLAARRAFFLPMATVRVAFIPYLPKNIMYIDTKPREVNWLRESAGPWLSFLNGLRIQNIWGQALQKCWLRKY